MPKREFPTPEMLRQVLRYEPDTGKLFWLRRPRDMFVSKRGCSTWNARFASKEAMTAISGGYHVGKVNYKLCMAHRVIWALVHGHWPENDIDHINGYRADNRLANLREATRSQNNVNSGVRADNTSGFKGVHFNKQQGKWQAQVYRNGKSKHLGFFVAAAEAGKAYQEAAKRVYGEFARAQ